MRDAKRIEGRQYSARREAGSHGRETDGHKRQHQDRGGCHAEGIQGGEAVRAAICLERFGDHGREACGGCVAPWPQLPGPPRADLSEDDDSEGLAERDQPEPDRDGDQADPVKRAHYRRAQARRVIGNARERGVKHVGCGCQHRLVRERRQPVAVAKLSQ